MIKRKLISITQAKKNISNINSSFTLPFSFNNCILRSYFKDNIRVIKSKFVFNVFYHELNKYTEPKLEYIKSKTKLEVDVFTKYKNNSKLNISTLININKDLTNGKGALRKGDLALNSYKYNQHVYFPDYKLAEKRLSVIIGLINKNKEIDFKFAVLIYVLLLNAHSFTDGNGRLSRVVFNLLTMNSYESYLPIYDIQHFSEGGYEIRLREAEIFNRWRPIIEYFKNCIQLCKTFDEK